MTGWKEEKLENIFYIVKEVYKPSNEHQYKYVGLEHIEQGTLRLNGWGYSNSVQSNKYFFKKDDILFGKLRPYFRKVIKAPFDGVCSTDIWVCRAKKDFDQNFLFYFLANQEFIDTANSTDEGTRMPRADWNYLKKTTWIIPPLPEQKAIAEVLSSFDDKINLLTRQNKTLEDLAQAYFRKWFIEDASKEWEVVPISEKFDVLLGGTPSRKIESYWTNGTIGWINSGKINEFRIIEASEYITEEALNNSSAKLLPAGTTVLAITGATLGKISMVLRSFAANQSVIGLVPKAELSNNFIFLWLKENINALISMQTGGAQQHINSNDVKSFDVIVPDTVALSLFRRKIDPLMLKISQNCFQINTLNKLRDTLLPKLISGEIRVKM